MEQKIRRDRNMGSNLRRLRDQYGISQEKLCAELQRRGCDIGRTAYAKYESGELNIRASVLIELRKIYSCSYDEFFAGLDRKQSHTFDLFMPKIEVIRKHRCKTILCTIFSDRVGSSGGTIMNPPSVQRQGA